MIPSITTPLLNHLWQSTLLVGIAWLGTLALRKNRARVRYWLWMAASLKFLVPAAILVNIGERIEWNPPPAHVQPAVSFVMQKVVEPAGPVFVPATNTGPGALIWLAFTAWFGGAAVVLFSWWKHWASVRATVQQARPIQLGPQNDAAGMVILSSPSIHEVGVVGIWHPALLLPDGLTNRLSPRQLESLIAHEREHIHSRDNLAAAIHAMVETLFWFHPAVWWIEKRLIDERECACDEAVLRAGNSPADYASGILEVCHYTVRSRLSPAAGINSSNLRQRLESIMRSDVGRPMSATRLSVAGLLGAALIAVPLVGGGLKTATEPQATVKFEVASVRPNKSMSLAMPSGTKGRTYTATNVPIRNVIAAAYKIPAARILAGPEWIGAASLDMRLIGGDRFDITAKLPEGTSAEQVPDMLRALLAERFKLISHSESRETAVYALVVSRSDGRLGPKLRKAEIDCEGTGTATPSPDRATVVVPNVKPNEQGRCELEVGGVILGRGQRMSTLARVLSMFAERPVMDNTGLGGGFDFELQLPESNTGPLTGERAADPISRIFAALPEQLGLKLESARGKLDFIVIDTIERPTEN
jgi:bla regulator protein BlaR1